MKKKVYLRKEPNGYEVNGGWGCRNKDGIICHFHNGIICVNPDKNKYPCRNPDIVYIKVREEII
jgi:hypothetical protein